MKKILWISPYAPYDAVAHGGGKTHNCYIKYFHKKGYDITLLSICTKEEEKRLDLDQYKIKNRVFVLDKTVGEKVKRMISSGVAFRNPYDPYGGVCLPYERRNMLKMIQAYYMSGEKPDFIMLQWTFSLMFVKKIKELFPNSKIIAIEEDVTFLNHERMKKNQNNTRWKRFFWQQRYERTKQRELACLSESDLIVTNNPKDTKLLIDCGINEKNIFTSAPYIENYTKLSYNSSSKDIVFYGAMSRAENYLSAIWFLDKVFPYIKDKETRFVIAGANPHELLKKYASDRVIITGFVEDAGQVLSNSRCMVAPLVGGAGIKIKVLEAMSAGLPVLTNEIGIEGIEATEGEDYIYCNNDTDYINVLDAIFSKRIDTIAISKNARRYIEINYNLVEILDDLMRILECY